MRSLAIGVSALCAVFMPAIASSGSIPEKPADATTLELEQPIAKGHKAVLAALKKLRYRVDVKEGQAYLEASSGPPLQEALQGAFSGRTSRVSEVKIWLEETDSGTHVYFSATVQTASPGGPGEGQLTSVLADDKKEEEALRAQVEKAARR